MMGVVIWRNSLERRPGVLARSLASPVILFSNCGIQTGIARTEKKYNISGYPALPHANQLTDLSKLIICGNKPPVPAVFFSGLLCSRPLIGNGGENRLGQDENADQAITKVRLDTFARDAWHRKEIQH